MGPLSLIRIVLASALVLGCVPASVLPTHHLPAGEGPTALLTGRLVEENGCLVVDGELVIWPRGTTRVGQSIHYLGERVANVGDVVELGGGEYGEEQYDFLRTLMDQDLAVSCRVGHYWLTVAIGPFPTVAPCVGRPLGQGRIHGEAEIVDSIEFTTENGETLTLFNDGPTNYDYVFDPALRVVDRRTGETIAVEGDLVSATGEEITGPLVLTLCELTRVE